MPTQVCFRKGVAVFRTRQIAKPPRACATCHPYDCRVSISGRMPWAALDKSLEFLSKSRKHFVSVSG
jgi:hypothetical protein